MRFAYHADDVIVMFTFVEEMPLIVLYNEITSVSSVGRARYCYSCGQGFKALVRRTFEITTT